MKYTTNSVRLDRALSAIINQTCLYPQYRYTSVAIDQGKKDPAIRFTFCIDEGEPGLTVVSLARCSPSDTYCRKRGQNEAANKIGAGDVTLVKDASGKIAEIFFHDAADDTDYHVVNTSRLTERQILGILAYAYEAALAIERNNPDRKMIYPHQAIIQAQNAFMSAYFCASYKKSTSMEKEDISWQYIDLMPEVCEVMRYALYYYACMVRNIADGSVEVSPMLEVAHNLYIQGEISIPEPKAYEASVTH